MTANQGFSLVGRVGLVTGSTSGLGWAIAYELHQAGATVVLHGREPTKLAAAASAMGVSSACFDVTAYDDVQANLEKIVATHGRLDIVVCNAAVRDRRRFAETDPESYRRLLEVNTVAPLQMARLASAVLTPQTGRFIFVSSTGARRPFRGDAMYASSKAALESLARSLAYEFGSQGITANAIAPGFTATEFNEPLMNNPEIADFVRTRVPAARWGQPQGVGQAAVFLASDAAAYVTGHVLTIDGGLSAVIQ